MNNFGNSPGGMKRPLADPRQRLQPGRFGPGRGHQQQFPPRHQQQLQMGGPGRGRPPQQQFGRGRTPGHQPPLGGPGRGFPMHQQQPGTPHMGQHPQQQFPQRPQGGGGRGYPMNRGQQAPPPPPPQRPPFQPPSAMNNNHNRMHNVPPAPPNMGIGYGQNNMNHSNVMGGRGPPPPGPRQPFQAQHQQGQYPQQHQYNQMNQSPPPRHHQQPVQQQGVMVAPFQAHKPANQQQHHHHQGHQQPHNQYTSRGQPPMHNHLGQPQQRPPNSYSAMPSPLAKQPIQQQQASIASPKNVTTPYTQAQIDQAWSEHVNKGVKYYHNSILQTSTYEKPQALLTVQERQVQAAQQQAQQKAASTAQSSTSSTWTEYTDASTGKKYYSNGVTTTWEKPEGFVSPSAIVAQSVAAEEAAAASTHESGKKRRKVKDHRETPFRNSEEAVAAFKGLLLAKGVSPTQKWNEVVKMCSSDARWDDCEAVLTTGERKQAMAEYQTKRFNDLKDQERQERARAKDAFSQLLSEVLPKLPAFSVMKTRFADIRDHISKDDRFYAVPTEADRETLYLDFCEELRKHDERKKRSRKREAQDAFVVFLKEQEEAGTLKFSSTWNSFLSSLSQSDKDDNRFKVSSAMSDSNRQLYFADFVIELQAQEDDKRRRIRDARRRAEKAQRDAYRDSLERLGAEGKLTPSSHWRDIERTMEGDSTYEAVLEQDRDAPREIFEEFIDEWDEVYRRDRQFLSQLVHPSSNREILVTRDTKYDVFVKALLEEANNSPQAYAEARRITKAEEPISSARLYFNDLVNKAKEKVTPSFRRRSYGTRRGSMNEDSSEDEGEIIEDGEVKGEESSPARIKHEGDGGDEKEGAATSTNNEKPASEKDSSEEVADSDAVDEKKVSATTTGKPSVGAQSQALESTTEESKKETADDKVFQTSTASKESAGTTKETNDDRALATNTSNEAASAIQEKEDKATNDKPLQVTAASTESTATTEESFGDDSLQTSTANQQEAAMQQQISESSPPDSTHAASKEATEIDKPANKEVVETEGLHEQPESSEDQADTQPAQEGTKDEALILPSNESTHQDESLLDQQQTASGPVVNQQEGSQDRLITPEPIQTVDEHSPKGIPNANEGADGVENSQDEQSCDVNAALDKQSAAHTEDEVDVDTPSLALPAEENEALLPEPQDSMEETPTLDTHSALGTFADIDADLEVQHQTFDELAAVITQSTTNTEDAAWNLDLHTNEATQEIEAMQNHQTSTINSDWGWK